jgi:hypothetical protein
MNWQNILQVPRYDSRKLFVIFSVVMVALAIEVGISTIADILSKQTITFWGVTLFVAIALIYIVGQYFILGLVKARKKETDQKLNKRFLTISSKTATIVQYLLSAIMVFVVLQIIIVSHYYTDLLAVSTALSYGLAIFLMSILAYRLFSWFTINRNPVVLLFGLAAAAIIVNAVDTIIYYDAIILGKPSITTPQSQVIFQTGFTPGTAMYVVNLIQTYSLNGYFILIWAGTILLLRHHIQRVGRVKFWIIVTFPVIFFLSYEMSLYQQYYPSSPVTTAISSSLTLPILLYTYATMICGILFGFGFRSVSRTLHEHSQVRDYMVITAYGFVLFVNAAQATVLQAGYPPYGLANVSSVGLASFMVLIGLYNSAISVAQDVKLRESIKASTLQQSSKLLDSIGTAEMTKQIHDNVIKITKEKSSILAEQDGVEPSLTDTEIRSYLDEVMEELVRFKATKQ